MLLILMESNSVKKPQAHRDSVSVVMPVVKCPECEPSGFATILLEIHSRNDFFGIHTHVTNTGNHKHMYIHKCVRIPRSKASLLIFKNLTTDVHWVAEKQKVLRFAPKLFSRRDEPWCPRMKCLDWSFPVS